MNKVINSSDFKDKLKFGLSGTYVFFGEEEYMKYHYLQEARRSVLGNDEDGEMRHKKISCIDFDTEKITDALTTVSMGFFEGKTLCELHELQLSAFREAEWKALCDIISEASPDVVTIIYTTPDEFEYGLLPKSPSKALQRLSEYAVPVYFSKESEAKLSRWITKHLIAEKLSFENGVPDLILKRCGRDMFVLSGELEKLCAYVKAGERAQVTSEDVFKVCCQNLEINAFDFSNAILAGDTDRAYALLSDMKLRKEKPVYILSSVTKVVSDMYAVKALLDSGMTDNDISKKLKMHEYKVGLYRKSAASRSMPRLCSLLRLCCDTDIKLKSTSLEDYTELDKLVILASV